MIDEKNGLDESPFPDLVEIEITDVFDLHSIAPRDVKRVTNDYLRLESEKNFRVVRIIHGKGFGVERDVVRRILAETDFVEEYNDSPAFSGHWGAMIAKLRQK